MSSSPVYIGLWHDYSVGSVLRETITIQTGYGDYLISALAFFVTLVGGAFWHLVALIIHQMNASKLNPDPLAIEHQLAYRTSDSPSSLAWTLTEIYLAWRVKATTHPVEGLFRRSFLRILPPLLVAIGFSASSVLVTYVAKPAYGTSDVLIRRGQCGLIEYDVNITGGGTGSIDAAADFNTLAQSSRAYARSCYPSGVRQSGDCSFFTVQNLPYNISSSPCPFGNNKNGSLCAVKADDVFLAHSEMLDSNDDLGINAPRDQSLLVQYNLTCSPINVTPYITRVQSEDLNIEYNLGPVAFGNSYTYRYDTHKIIEDVGYQLRLVIPLDSSFVFC